MVGNLCLRQIWGLAGFDKTYNVFVGIIRGKKQVLTGQVLSNFHCYPTVDYQTKPKHILERPEGMNYSLIHRSANSNRYRI